MSDTDLKEPVWKRTVRSWGRSRQLHQIGTLMAALNIHCCRWVWVWINSLTNECKLRTKQPKGNKGICRESPGRISCWAGWELLLSLKYWLKSLLLPLILLWNKFSKFLVFCFSLLLKRRFFFKLRKWHLIRFISWLTPYYKTNAFIVYKLKRITCPLFKTQM